MMYQVSKVKTAYFSSKLKMVALCFMFCVLIFGVVNPLNAQETDPPEGTVSCTTDPDFFAPELGEDAFDMIKNIVTEVDSTLTTASESLYTGIIGNADYQAAMVAAITGFIIIYGVAILFGLVPVTLAQAAIRLFKLGIIFTLISTDVGWETTSEFVGGIFNGGTLEIINSIIALSAEITVGDGAGCSPAFINISAVDAPVEIFRCAMTEVLNPRVFVLLFATFTTGPYGLIMGLALGWALYSLFMMMIRAFQVYVLSLIVRALLIGMSPLFFGFLFFEKTKPIFMGWLNQLVNFSLQPIMLFAFLAFFLQLVTGALFEMLPRGEVDACFTKAMTVGGGQQGHGWKFMIGGQEFQGSWTSRGPVASDLDGGGSVEDLAKIFPITPISILVFIILTYIASEMATVVTQMAAEMSQGYVKLDEGHNQDVIRNLAPKK